MEIFSSFFTKTIPNYFSSLPIPNSIEGFRSLSTVEILELVPFYVLLGLISYVLYSELSHYSQRKKSSWVNKDYGKSQTKIVDTFTKAELETAFEKKDKVIYCRCWKSKTFPYCDGSHNKHNETTGDNVGPLIIKN